MADNYWPQDQRDIEAREAFSAWFNDQLCLGNFLNYEDAKAGWDGFRETQVVHVSGNVALDIGAALARPAPEALGAHREMARGKEHGRVMMSAHALCPHGLSHPARMRWMAEYFLANYPSEALGAAKGEWVNVTDEVPHKLRTVLASYTNCAGKQRIIRAKFVPAKTVEANTDADDCACEYDEETDTYWLQAGWYEQIDNWGDYSSVAVCEGDVTHWMPLPPPPAPTAKDQS